MFELVDLIQPKDALLIQIGALTGPIKDLDLSVFEEVGNNLGIVFGAIILLEQPAWLHFS